MKKATTIIFCFLLLQIAVIDTASAQTSVQNAGYADTTILPVINQPATLPYQSSIFKRRLDSIKKDIPLDYNEYVQGYIDLYMRNRDEMGRVLGLTKYYFPIYEKAFRDAGIPEEIKYLSVVESKLDPFAVSRVGATGPWQFMYSTGKLYGLNTDEYTDDRRDPIQATYAAAAYLKDAYQEFGDWLLALASYNCGKSNVEHAIEKAGVSDYWIVRQYLPAETRGYVPAFIAVAYVMNYYNRHNIVPQACSISLKTDTVMVNKYVSLSIVARALNVDIRGLAALNPAYKLQIVNGTNAAPRRLIIPQVDRNRFSALYDVLNSSSASISYVPKAQPQPAPVPVAQPVVKPGNAVAPLYHIVKEGEKLGDIAAVNGIDMQDLKAWNHLHSNHVLAGQRLKLNNAAPDIDDSDSKVIHRVSYITYKVKTGDTLSSIASKFDGASVAKIKSVNGLKKNHLQPGMTIKI